MKVSSKSFNFVVSPLIPSCAGLIVGLTICFFFNTFISLYFCFFWFCSTVLFTHVFQQVLCNNAKALYYFLHFFIFIFCGGTTFHLNKQLTTILLDKLSIPFCNLVTQVDEISQNTQGRYPFRILLNLGETAYAFHDRYLILFLRKNFLQIGDFAVLWNYKLLPASNSDLRLGSLGSIFYQPGQMHLQKYRPLALNFKQRLNSFKRNLCKRILNKMSALTKSFYGLIFLGYRQKEVPVNLRLPFQSWGVSHYLARSGLHLTIFSYFCFFIFMILPLGLAWRYFVAICISLVYYFLTYVSVSFLRAEFMFLMGMFAKIFVRQSQQLHFLVLTCMIVLLFNPYQLFSLDFQLSFALVFALLLISHLLSKQKRETNLL